MDKTVDIKGDSKKGRQRKHWGVSAFVCSGCNRKFGNPGALATHKKMCVKKELVKPDAFALMERREKVEALRWRAFSYRAIAKVLSISVGAVEGDMQAIRRQNLDEYRKKDKEQIIADRIAKMEKQEMQLTADYFDVPVDSAARSANVRLMVDIGEKMWHRLQDVGMLPKSAEEMNVTVGKKDYRRMTREELIAEKEALIMQLVSNKKKRI